MSVEELLKPRFKVIADWLGNDCFIVGDIFFDDDIRRNTKKWKNAVFSGFPHLFKKLEWWEERDENEMPKYLKQDTHPKDFCLVLKHFQEEKDYCCTGVSKLFGKNTTIHYKHYLPATKEEYENQNKQ